LVTHGAITFEGKLLIGSDDTTGDGGLKQGVAVNHPLAYVDEARRVLDALAEGVVADMPMAETFWPSAFGACTDRFGKRNSPLGFA
jgi:PhnB protein